MSEDRISKLRQEIDQLDGEILDLIRKRMRISAEVSQAKSDKTAIFRPGREEKLFAALAQKSAGLPPVFVHGLWRVIISASIGLQKTDFTIATSPKALSDAIGFAAGQLHVAAPVAGVNSLVAMLEKGQADIAVIASSEIYEAAPLLVASSRVSIIASLRSQNGKDKQISSYILSSQKADRTEYDIAVMFDKHKNEIVFQSYDAYLEDAKTDFQYIGCFAQFNS